MANDFSGDSNCLALYRFESGALTTDSKGSITLSDVGVPVADTTNYKEGSCAFVGNGNDGFYRADNDLPSDFPFKNGTTNRILSFAGWIRPTIIPGSGIYDDIITKWDTNSDTCSFSIRLTNGKLQLCTGYGAGGSSQEYHDICTLNIANRFYHIGFSLNGTTGAWSCRLWDDTAQTANTYSGTLTNTPVAVSTAYLYLFCEWYDFYTTNFMHGQGDEFVIFKDIVTVSEFDAIRQGTYSATSIKTTNGLLITSCKTINGLAIASMGSWNGLT